MIVWGRNKCSRPLPADCVPFETIRKDSVSIKRPLAWPRDWGGWSFGRMAGNSIDEKLKQLESKNERQIDEIT